MTGTVAIVQARMGSTRLPGKVVASLAGLPVLWHVVHRLKKVKSIDRIVLAVPEGPEDDILETFARGLGAAVVRGSREDVLARFAKVVDATDPRLIVRVTGDAPLVDPDFIAAKIALLAATGGDYPLAREGECVHQGVDVLSRRAFDRLRHEAAADPLAREHITAYIKAHPENFHIVPLEVPKWLDRPFLRLTVDTPDDLRFMQSLYEKSGAWPGELKLAEALALVDQEPKLAMQNAHVRQKAPDEREATVLLRVDGGDKRGLGHVRRMLSLARSLRDREALGVRALMREMSGSDIARDMLAAAGIKVRTMPESDDGGIALLAAARETDARIVVLDIRERIAPSILDRLRADGRAVVTIDDASPNRLGADLAFLPPVPQVAELAWPGFTGTLVADWRHVVLGWTGSAPAPAKPSMAQRVLVLTGGSDAYGLIRPIVQSLSALAVTASDPVEVAVVVGPAVPHRDARLAELKEAGHAVYDAPEGLGEPFAAADVAVSVFGVSAYEVVAAGVPTVLIAMTADDLRSAGAFADAGLARVVDGSAGFAGDGVILTVRELLSDAAARAAMSDRQRAAIDGGGADRVAMRIGALARARQSAAPTKKAALASGAA